MTLQRCARCGTEACSDRNHDLAGIEYGVSEQLDALVKANNLLTSIMTRPADQNPSTKGKRLEEEASKEYAARKPMTSNCTEELELEKLQQEWKLEQTGFSRLWNACNSLREMLRLTAVEADEAIQDASASQSSARKAQMHAKAFQLMARNLKKENYSLKDRISHLEGEVKKLKSERRAMAKEIVRVRQENDCLNEQRMVALARLFEGTLLSDASTAPTTSDEESSYSDLSAASIIDRPQESMSENEEADSAATHSANSQAVLHRLIFSGTKTGIKFVKVRSEARPVGSVLRSGHCQSTASNKTEANTSPATWYPSTGTHAFFVCGFHDFDDTANKRPAVGSRLFAVNGKSLEEARVESFQQLRDMISSAKKPATLSFRQDPLGEHEAAKVMQAFKRGP